MREQLQRRLEALKNEFNTGRAREAELDKQQAMLHQTLLRISGAIQVLEEELKSHVQGDAQTDSPLGDSAKADVRHVNGSRAHVEA